MLVHVCDGSIVCESHCGGDIRRPHPAEDTVPHSCTSLWQNSGLETVLRGTNWEDVDHMVNIICPCFVKVTPDFNFLL